MPGCPLRFALARAPALLAAALLLAGGSAHARDAADEERETQLDTIPVDANNAPADLAAAEDTGPAPREERTALSYASVGLSRVWTDYQNVSDATNLDLAMGWRLPFFDWVSGEFDLAFTVMPGDYKGPQQCETIPPNPITGDPGGTECEPGTFSSNDNDLQMTNIGAFGVLRTPGSLYGLGKIGYRVMTISIPEIQDGDDTHGIGYAAGAGYRWAGYHLSGIELLYSRYSREVDFIGLNVAYGFGAAPEPD